MPVDKRDDSLSALEFKVMMAIYRQRPDAYGISIQEELNKDPRKKWSLGSIYAVLQRLEEKNFATSKMGEATAERGGKAKLHYVLTGTGEAALMAEWNMVSAMGVGAGLKVAII